MFEYIYKQTTWLKLNHDLGDVLLLLLLLMGEILKWIKFVLDQIFFGGLAYSVTCYLTKQSHSQLAFLSVPWTILILQLKYAYRDHSIADYLTTNPS